MADAYVVLGSSMHASDDELRQRYDSCSSFTCQD